MFFLIVQENDMSIMCVKDLIFCKLNKDKLKIYVRIRVSSVQNQEIKIKRA